MTPRSTDPVRRFAIDDLRLPERRADFATDLDGDGRADNQLANLVTLATAAGYFAGAHRRD